LLGYISRWNCF